MKEKLRTIEDLASTIEDGMTIGIGGSTLRRHPMALLRELVRQGRKDLTLQAWLGGLDFDFLVGAGAVRRIECAYVGLGPLGLSPNVRRLADSGELDVRFFTESSMIARFKAAAAGHPFGITRVIAGTDYDDPELIREITDPFTGATLHAVAPAQPQVTLLHGYYSDEFGNIQRPTRYNRDDVDVLLASASDRVIVTVEQLISHDEVVRRPHSTYLPHHWVDGVALAPFGAHPGPCDALYEPDFAALDDYLAAAKDPEKFRQYLETNVLPSKNNGDYLARVTSPATLAAIRIADEV